MLLGTLSVVPFVLFLIAEAANPRAEDEDPRRARPNAAVEVEPNDENRNRTETGARDRASDSFTPSERIPADTTVPFPADI